MLEIYYVCLLTIPYKFFIQVFTCINFNWCIINKEWEHHNPFLDDICSPFYCVERWPTSNSRSFLFLMIEWTYDNLCKGLWWMLTTNVGGLTKWWRYLRKLSITRWIKNFFLRLVYTRLPYNKFTWEKFLGTVWGYSGIGKNAFHLIDMTALLLSKWIDIICFFFHT